MRSTVLAALFALLAGCSAEEKLFDVSGTVTFGGKPVPKGLIFFEPDAAKGNTGPQGTADIVAGKFSTAAPGGKGVRGGAYIVRINAFDGIEAPEAPFGAGLCPEYTESKELPPAPSTLDVALPGGKKR